MAIDIENYVKACAAIARSEAPYLSTVKRAPASSRTGGRKCESCGSREYAATKAGAICSYCRTPKYVGETAEAAANSTGCAAILGSLWGS